MKEKFVSFFKKETVFVISGLAALLSAFFVHPSIIYVDYIDFKVIGLLFSLMMAVEGLRQEGTFEVISQKLLRLGNSVRFISFVLVIICFFLSMLVTNDVALITMVPFTFTLLDFISEKRMIFIVVMETVAANLGSMLTPIGNPQNLYLYSFYNLDAWEFFAVTLPVCAVSLLAITATMFIVRTQRMKIVFDVDVSIKDRRRFLLNLFVFFICILTVGHMLDYRVMLIIALCLGFLFQPRLLIKVDYFLLMTFIFFFVFVGNMGQIPQVREAVFSLIQGREFLVGLGLSQVISNVPAAVMLSTFTDNYKALILGTDIGGLGTLVASLASLISFKFYSRRKGARTRLYLLVFTGANVAYLVLLGGAAYFLIL